MSLFACLAFLHGSGGAYGGDGIMNPRRFAIVAPTFCGTVVLAGGIVGWLAGFGSAGTENARAVPIEDRAASLAATARLADEPQAIAMANAVVANATVASAEVATAAEPAAGTTTDTTAVSDKPESIVALPVPSQMLSADLPPVQESVGLGHRDVAQPAPTRCGASGGSSNSGPQDFRYLICYVWSELPPAEKPAAIVLRSFKDIPVGTPVEEIKRASDAFGLDFTFMKAVAKVESGFDPKQRTGSYIGLFQLSKYEFGKFGSGDILNPRDNAVAAAYKVIIEGILFQWVTHREPDLNDLYLIHQQGWEGAAEHLSQPNRIAWKSMCATSEGREKGEKWCRRAIWRNTLPAVKEAWKSVEKLTSEAFVGMWRERVAHFYSKYMTTATADAERAHQ
ncbi:MULTISPECIES: transglycosylase SLT domain-containing protein [Bradyrhizobium]|uniref:transglycosylase SLT domain-containing protein n=1 Tax=Bradyrhizobium TaxID=374 RepID=UPI000D728204|nr:transglycosylase SLT domain-containing protein [Bradyrhizobium diazoefficiens]AWO94488.1 transglycosylase SLT domain-containing protein [Bradyrhizobium diazoefficiens]